MKNKLLFYAFTLLLLFGCKKMETPIEAATQQQEIKRTKLDSFFVSNRKIAGFGTNNMVQANSIDVIQSNTSGGGSSFSGSFEDDEIPTILGQHLANPYTLPNMQVAYQLMGVNITPQVTDLYVNYFTNSQMWDAISNGNTILDMQSFKTKMINLNPTQVVNTNSLFNQYGF